MKHLFLSSLLMLSCATAAAQHVVWFDSPNSLRGREVWWGGHPERFSADYKPIDAGQGAVNPDQEWERRSLPLGNGSIGCNVMGSVSTERYTLNEKTLWRGGPNTATGAKAYWNQNIDGAKNLPAIRQAFQDGDLNKAARLTQESFTGNAPYEAAGEPAFRFGSFTTMGELCLETAISDQGISHYRRALDLDSALATVSFTAADGTTYSRRTFVSYPANVMAVKLTASAPGRQTFTLSYAPNPCATGTFSPDGQGGLVYSGRLDNNQMAYVVRIRVNTKGGSVEYKDGKL
ncbi:MAG: glycoside hydrolase family 95 protein, partial [Rothia sp. (in: high G+C Gram-positive bacteria)]|uniref:glycoside hydrolase family 95 protein n=1 Tax=Rothia sp. (in: high G+C Gram-positive bacteria) TaxID=1885016 RepID=UPI0026E08EC2